MKKRGAKGKYDQWLQKDGLLLLEAWARDGLTDEQIASNCGIRRETLYDWKNKHPNISNALKKGKEVADIEVENALFKRALGYAYQEVHEEYEFGELVKKKVVKKHMPPEPVCQFFILKNRKKEVWRDKWDIENAENTKQLEELRKIFEVVKGE